MAGKLGLAVKLILGTTLLAGGGAGAWYGTTQGWPTLSKTDATNAANSSGDNGAPADAAHVASADLDAVASAWSEPAAKTAVATRDSSPIARSAEPPKETSKSEIKKHAPGDRYALPPLPSETDTTSTASSTIETPKKDTAVEPAAAEVTKSDAPATKAKDEDAPSPDVAPKAVATVEAKEVAPTTDTAVARGQEPKEAELQALAGDTGDGELQPLSATPSKGSISAPTNRPGNTLRDSAVVPAGDRYGNAATRNIPAAASDAAKSEVVNPFSAGTPSPTPTAPAQIAAGKQSTAALQRSFPNNSNAAPPMNNGAAAINSPGVSALAPLPPSPEIVPLREDPRTGRVSAPEPIDAPRADSTMIGGRTAPASRFGEAEPPANNILSRGGAVAEGEGTGKPGEKALEGPQKPSLEIQKFAPGEIQVGKPAKFVVRVRNVGTQPAEDVAIHDEVPQGTKLVSTTPDAQNIAGKLAWDLGKLSPGEDRTVEMQLMPVTEGEIGSVATVSYAAQASVKTKCTMPQLAIRMTAPAKVMIGQDQHVKIELRNPGSGDATSVMLFENVPQNVKHAAGPALEFEIGTLKSGETRELELTLHAEKAGKTVNILSAKADGNLQVQQQVEFEVIAPGLSVAVDGPERRYLERPATYEVSVENPGTAPAHDVKIVTKLPKGLRFVRANNMGEYDANTHAVYWSLAELPEGEKGTVELVAMPVETGPQTLDVETKAGQGLSDQTQRQIVVDGLAAIMFEVKDLEDPIEVGGETGYEIRVVNQGTKAATNVKVAVNLPPGMKLVSAEGETPHAEQRGAIVFEPLGQLAPKADTVFRIRTQGTAAGDQRVMVEVNTDDLAQPIRREESTLVYGDE